MTAAVLRLQPAPAVTYGPCPGWCIGHGDISAGTRTHAGSERAVLGRTATGQQAYVRLRPELRDDGGQRSDLYVLDVAGVVIELPPMQMYALFRAAEKVFWHLDDSGYAPASATPVERLVAAR